jgi:preprotein translocase subunit SecD
MIDPIEIIRKNWRVLLLAFMLVGATYFLFVDGAPISGPASSTNGTSDASVGSTNLVYDIQLAGGARLEAPVEGYYVDADVTQDQDSAVKQSVAEEMRIDPTSIVTYPNGADGVPAGTVEVREVNDSVGSADQQKAAFARGLQDAGLDVDAGDINRGVTDDTMDNIVTTIDQRLAASDISGGEVSQRSTASGPDRVVIEAPGQNIEDIEELVNDRGLVQQFAHAPADDEQGYAEQELLRQEDMERIGTAGTNQDGRPGVPVTLQLQSADKYVTAMKETGVADNPSRCNTPSDVEDPEPPYGYCVVTKIDGENIRIVSISPGLAQEIRSGNFEQNPSFWMSTNELEEAKSLQLRMRSGAMPAELDLDGDRASRQQVSAELAAGFRQNSLVTGMIAVLTVVVVVFLRYGDPRVAAPMAVTALSELAIILGFVSALGIPLDLAALAGMIAVVGTGVDDLIIIADEVISEGEVDSRRVFDSRVRKAFWVIGAAAATTIIAMAPLALSPSLGELRLFAIITILGVIVGVAISRPAYGSILRALTTE